MKGHLRAKRTQREKYHKKSKWYCKSKHMMDAIRERWRKPEREK